MKQAYVTVYNEFLEGLLKLPEDVSIENVVANGRGGIPNTFIVCLKGGGLPEFTELKEGEAAQHVTIIYEKFSDADNLVPNVHTHIKEIKKV